MPRRSALKSSVPRGAPLAPQKRAAAEKGKIDSRIRRTYRQGQKICSIYDKIIAHRFEIVKRMADIFLRKNKNEKFAVGGCEPVYEDYFSALSAMRSASEEESSA